MTKIGKLLIELTRVYLIFESRMKEKEYEHGPLSEKKKKKTVN